MQRLRTARCDDDIFRREFKPEGFVITDQLVPVRSVAFARAVFENLAVDVLECFQTDFGRFEVGLTDVEVLNFDSSGFGLIGIRHELADRRGRQ